MDNDPEPRPRRVHSEISGGEFSERRTKKKSMSDAGSGNKKRGRKSSSDEGSGQSKRKMSALNAASSNESSTSRESPGGHWQFAEYWTKNISLSA